MSLERPSALLAPLHQLHNTLSCARIVSPHTSTDGSTQPFSILSKDDYQKFDTAHAKLLLNILDYILDYQLVLVPEAILKDLVFIFPDFCFKFFCIYYSCIKYFFRIVPMSHI